MLSIALIIHIDSRYSDMKYIDFADSTLSLDDYHVYFSHQKTRDNLFDFVGVQCIVKKPPQIRFEHGYYEKYKRNLAQKGGLFIADQNDALLTKWLWKLQIHSESPWADLVLKLYGTTDLQCLSDQHGFTIHQIVTMITGILLHFNRKGCICTK
jgi:hypothetical protein